MKDKYLPVKIFEKRKDYDDRETEGGGDKNIPKWVLNGDELAAHSNLLQEEVESIQSAYSEWKKREEALPLIIKTTIHEKAIAKTHRKNIVSVLESDGKDNVIGVCGDRQVLSIISTDEVLNNLGKAVQNQEEQAVFISALTELEVFKPFIESYNTENPMYQVKLCNYNSYDINNWARIIFERRCAEKGIKIEKKTRYTAEMYLYRVCLDSMEELSLLGEFEGLYSVEEARPVLATMDSLEENIAMAIKVPDSNQDYPIVGVLDTGIANISYLKDWKTEDDFTNYPEEYQDNGHGTFVAGIIEYGDELNETGYSSIGGVKLFDATVYPNLKKETIYPDMLVDHIREAVERNSHIKIWNLSLGTNDEAELDEFSDFGMALDNIQDENNVLIIKSAGNCENFLRNKAKSRVAKSADSVRSLVVGSLAEDQNEWDYAEPNTPSPFSRVGPGPASIVKPDLVFYGGNAGVKDGKLITSGVPSFALDESVRRMVGTSFATPRVTRIAAELNYMLQEEFDSLMIRALMIHNARYPKGNRMNMADKVGQMGFGMPIGASDILFNSPDEITLILRDTLDKGNFIEMFDFPYPDSLIDENGYFTGQITVTLVNNTIVDDKQAGEYCQSNIDVAFGTYETERERDTSKPIIKNPMGVGGAENVLKDSLYAARAKGAYPLNGFERECTLVKYGKKFHPVKKYAFDLNDMTPANRDKCMHSSRKWYLKIEGLYRDFIEKDALKKGYQLSQDYCMILTIKDPTGKAPVYNEVAQQLTYRNFIHHDIHVKSNVHVTSVLKDDNEKAKM